MLTNKKTLKIDETNTQHPLIIDDRNLTPESKMRDTYSYAEISKKPSSLVDDLSVKHSAFHQDSLDKHKNLLTGSPKKIFPSKRFLHRTDKQSKEIQPKCVFTKEI